MPQQDLIQIWQGERVLLPKGESNRPYRLHCVSGSGLVRFMSRSRPYQMKPRHTLMIPADEIVTVSGTEDMVILLQPETE